MTLFASRQIGARGPISPLASVATLVLLLGSPLVSLHAQSDDVDLAWNRTDRYVAPDFDAYFAESSEADVALLYEFLSNANRQNAQPEAFLTAVRKGLRGAKHKSRVLTAVGNNYIWQRSPQRPTAIELMYHASASDDATIRHFAMYQGLTVVEQRSMNLMRLLMRAYPRLSLELQRRIHWGFKQYGDPEQTKQLLLGTLEESETQGELATLASVKAYRELTQSDPPRMARFKDLGRWVMAVRTNRIASPDSNDVRQLRALLTSRLRINNEKLIDFVSRVENGNWVGVFIVQGLGERDRILQLLDELTSGDFTLVFQEPFTELVLIDRRLRGFAKHLEGGLPAGAAPAYRPNLNQEQYAFNRTDRYVPSNYERYFPDDEAAAKRLEKIYSQRETIELSDRELLEAVRKGLRRSSHPHAMIAWISSALGWPSDPACDELLYHAIDPAAPEKIRYTAVYHRWSRREERPANVLRTLARVIIEQSPRKMNTDSAPKWIIWGVRNDAKQKAVLADYVHEQLAKHRELTAGKLIQLDAAYEQLAGEPNSQREAYQDRVKFLAIFTPKSITVQEAMKAWVEQNLAQEQFVIKTGLHTTKDDQAMVACVLRGFKGVDWFTKAYVEGKKVNLLGVLPLAPEMIDDRMQQELPMLRELLNADENATE